MAIRTISFSQINIVPNNSFEFFTSCPFATNQLFLTIGWSSPTSGGGTPDYFNSCDTFNYVGVPNNLGGFQNARTGSCYAGLISFVPANFREYIQIKLDSVLEPNVRYCSEFFVSLADTDQIACNNIGVYFSDTAINSSNSNALNVIPQINNNIITNSLTDKIHWTKVSGSFMAVGGEQYITIGNFLNNANSDTILVNGGTSLSSYYYIDDVNVHRCAQWEGISELGVKNEELIIMPNPATNELRINISAGSTSNASTSSATNNQQLTTIKIYNVLGECVYQSAIKQLNTTTINIEDFQKGIYFVEVIANPSTSSGYNNVIRKKFVKQ